MILFERRDTIPARVVRARARRVERSGAHKIK